MKAIQLFTVFLISFLLLLLLVPLGGYGGHTYKFMAGAIVFAAVTYYFLHRYKENRSNLKILMVLLVSASMNVVIPLVYGLFQGISIMNNLMETRLSWPSSFAFFLGIGFGYWIFIIRKSLRGIPIVLLLLISSWVFFSGYDSWLHKLNYGTFSGRVDEPFPMSILENENENSIAGNFVNEDILVLDVWSTSCGICFREMPEFQELAYEFKGNGNIRFLMVNMRLMGDSAGVAKTLLNEEKVSLPISYLSREHAHEISISCVPTYLVIDHGRMIFRGGFEQLPKVLSRLNLDHK